MNLGPPIQPLRCNNPDCAFPAGGRCARAAELADPGRDCPDLERDAVGEAPQPSTREPSRAPSPLSPDAPVPTTPWTGRPLDTDEVRRLLWRSPARVIAVLGNRGTGKTCLLTSFFLQLAHGQRGPFAWRFAGSQTLHGLHALCERAARWDGVSAGQIVDATPVSETDTPRLFLHLTLRPLAREDRRVLDLILTDIPGEWVRDWAERQDEVAARRLSFLDRCDGLLVLADAAALTGAERGTVDAATSLVLRRATHRLLTRRRPPPVGLVFSKFDRVVADILPPTAADAPPEAWGPLADARRTWAAVRGARDKGLDLRPFAVSAFPDRVDARQPVGVMSPFAWLMERADPRAPWLRPASAPIPEGASSFETLRRREEDR